MTEESSESGRNRPHTPKGNGRPPVTPNFRNRTESEGGTAALRGEDHLLVDRRKKGEGGKKTPEEKKERGPRFAKDLRTQKRRPHRSPIPAPSTKEGEKLRGAASGLGAQKRGKDLPALPQKKKGKERGEFFTRLGSEDTKASDLSRSFVAKKGGRPSKRREHCITTTGRLSEELGPVSLVRKKE